MIYEVIYAISSIFYISSTIYMIIRIRHALSTMKKEEIRREIMEFMRSKEMTEIIKNALNESELNEKLNAIVLVLCTHVPELKRSKLCEGEI